MKQLPFNHSSLASIGVELELQIIDPMTYGMLSRAKDLIRNVTESPFEEKIKPEITQSMIELNSSVHQTPSQLYADLNEMRLFLLMHAEEIGIKIAGGGTHPFQKWALQKIFPTTRFKNLSHHYRYLSKRSTVFGQHIHVGCPSSEDALYLTHALARYVPHFIAISASSPFYQGIDTGYQSARSNVFSAFPSSGVIPYLLSWKEFSEYFYKMKQLKIIRSMKDFYWDIRPKPEFGTVEVRVCDTPLTIKKAVIIAAYIQTLSHYLLQEKTITPSHDLYYLYGYNRFQSIRYGFEGDFINPMSLQHTVIAEDILETIKLIDKHTRQLNNSDWLESLTELVNNKKNDTELLRQIFKETGSLPKVVSEQCLMWEKD
ncbi:MAG: YbdK family carboxylate-amine ligase [Gammaproteobacteria bacterium]